MFHSYVNLPVNLLFFYCQRCQSPSAFFRHQIDGSDEGDQICSRRSRFRRRKMNPPWRLEICHTTPCTAQARARGVCTSEFVSCIRLDVVLEIFWPWSPISRNEDVQSEWFPTKYHLGTPQTQFRPPKNPWFLVELDSPKHPKQPRFYWLCQKAKLHHVARKRLQWGHWNIYWNKNNPMLEYDHVD